MMSFIYRAAAIFSNDGTEMAERDVSDPSKLYLNQAYKGSAQGIADYYGAKVETDTSGRTVLIFPDPTVINDDSKAKDLLLYFIQGQNQNQNQNQNQKQDGSKPLSFSGWASMIGNNLGKTVDEAFKIKDESPHIPTQPGGNKYWQKIFPPKNGVTPKKVSIPKKVPKTKSVKIPKTVRKK